MEPLHFLSSTKNNICLRFPMVEHPSINKITDKSSSKNVLAPTQTPNIKVLSEVQPSPMRVRFSRNQIHNSKLQHLQHKLHKSFSRFRRIERQELHLQRHHHNRHTPNKVMQLRHPLRGNQQRKVSRPLKLLNRAQPPPSNRLNNSNSSNSSSNSPRSQ